MQIFFDAVATQDADQEDFIHNGDRFYYSIDASPDSFVIRDTSGRFVPFAIESVRPLIDALVILHSKAEPVINALPALEKLASDGVYSV